jgi:tripartite-type tricarboxylate transporter receptor subunit TctC
MHLPSPMRRRTVAALLLLAASPSVAFAADAYPSQPITLIVPFAPGGYTDVVARLLVDKMTPLLGQSVIVLNKAGAGSTIGTKQVQLAKPDGYTIGLVSMTFVLGPLLYKPAPFDPVKDFVPIGVLAETPTVMIVNPEIPAKTVKEFVALAKSKPGQLGYASSGNGSTQHLVGAMFTSTTGITMTHVPYRGSNQALVDVLSGQVASSFVGIPNALSSIKAGKLRALAVTTTTRAADLPDVPTMQEAGLAGFNVAGWLGLIAPAGTPPDIVAKVREAAAKALQNPDAEKALRAAGVDLRLSDGPAFTQLLQAETNRWSKVVADANVKVE